MRSPTACPRTTGRGCALFSTNGINHPAATPAQQRVFRNGRHRSRRTDRRLERHGATNGNLRCGTPVKSTLEARPRVSRRTVLHRNGRAHGRLAAPCRFSNTASSFVPAPAHRQSRRHVSCNFESLRSSSVQPCRRPTCTARAAPAARSRCHRTVRNDRVRQFVVGAIEADLGHLQLCSAWLISLRDCSTACLRSSNRLREKRSNSFKRPGA